jgi:5-methylcytosine-specific restriction endonuclease McrA
VANRYGNRSRTRTSSPEHRASRKRVLERDGYQCQIRGPRCIGTATVKDHIIAVADGGDESDNNGQAACAPCNQWKAQEEALRGYERRRARLRLPSGGHPGGL